MILGDFQRPAGGLCCKRKKKPEQNSPGLPGREGSEDLGDVVALPSSFSNWSIRGSRACGPTPCPPDGRPRPPARGGSRPSNIRVQCVGRGACQGGGLQLVGHHAGELGLDSRGRGRGDDPVEYNAFR